MFGFHSLDAYRYSIDAVADLAIIQSALPRGNAWIIDQLRRASLSIPLNIAEGTGHDAAEAARFFSIARASALECAATLDVIEVLRLAGAEQMRPAREKLRSVVAMLTRLRRRRG